MGVIVRTRFVFATSCAFGLSLFVFFFGQSAYGATMSVVPSVSNARVGEVFTVRVLVNTEGAFINNAEAVITYPFDLIDVISVNAKNSIFSLWVEQPSFSNASGQIFFNGGVVNPGYSGVSGEALSIVFRSKKEGVANILLNNVAVRENDGLGTDILRTFYPTAVVIRGVAVPTPSLAPAVDADDQRARSDESIGTGKAPIVSSPTCPDQSAWCSAKKAVFNWDLPSNAFAVQTLFGKNPDSIPSVYYSSAINTKEVADLVDGVWYFHVRYRDSSGWSDTAHYRINIDTLPPALSLSIQRQGQGDALVITAQDELSGVSRYDILIDGRKRFTLTAQEGSNPILLPAVSVGEHTVSVVAFDVAGNKTQKDALFVSQELVSPVVSLSSERVRSGDTFTIFGTSLYPRTTVKVVVVPEIGDTLSYEVTTDARGRFEIVGRTDLPSGVYSILGRVVSLDGALSPESNRVILIIDQFFGFSLGAWTIAVSLWTIIGVILGAVLFVGGGLLVVRKIRRYKKAHLAAERRAHQAFELLIERARHQMALLEHIRRRRGSVGDYAAAIKELDKTLDTITDLFKSTHHE